MALAPETVAKAFDYAKGTHQYADITIKFTDGCEIQRSGKTAEISAELEKIAKDTAGKTLASLSIKVGPCNFDEKQHQS